MTSPAINENNGQEEPSGVTLPTQRPTRRRSFKTLIYLVSLFIIKDVQARDTRIVVEPVTPQSCTTLKADNQDSTSRIQSALDSCSSGKGVLLSKSGGNDTFYSGPLTIPTNVSLIVGENAYLKAIPDPALFDKGQNTCGTLGTSGSGCHPFISMPNVVNSGLYGPGMIDGQGGAVMVGRNRTWWQLAVAAEMSNQKQSNPRLIKIDNAKNVVLYRIVLRNSPNFHVVFDNTDGLTAWGIRIETAASARNTDGFDPSGSVNVTLANSYISTGDDNVAIKAGSAPSSYISIVNNTFGTGHGMSIGSETNSGVSDVTVENLYLKGTSNGLRIKSDRSRGGLVRAVTYNNVCMEGVKYPIFMDTHYTSGATGDLIPEYRDITFNKIYVKSVGSFWFNGYSDDYPIRISFNDVHIKNGSIWDQNRVIIEGSASEDSSGSCRSSE